MSVEPTEIEELRGPVLGIIDAYGMGDSVDPPEAALEDRPRQLLHVRRAVRLCLPSGGPHPFADVVRDGYVDGRRRGVDEGVFRHRRSVVTSETWGKGGHLP